MKDLATLGQAAFDRRQQELNDQQQKLDAQRRLELKDTSMNIEGQFGRIMGLLSVLHRDAEEATNDGDLDKLKQVQAEVDNVTRCLFAPAPTHPTPDTLTDTPEVPAQSDDSADENASDDEPVSDTKPKKRFSFREYLREAAGVDAPGKHSTDRN